MAFLDQITKALGSFSPNILGALAILVVGWIVALIVSSIIGKRYVVLHWMKKLPEWL
jgi:hypothetical protein